METHAVCISQHPPPQGAGHPAENCSVAGLVMGCLCLFAGEISSIHKRPESNHIVEAQSLLAREESGQRPLLNAVGRTETLLRDARFGLPRQKIRTELVDVHVGMI